MKKWVISILFVLVIFMTGIAGAVDNGAPVSTKGLFSTAATTDVCTPINVGDAWFDTGSDFSNPPAFMWPGIPAYSDKTYCYSNKEPTCLYVTDAFIPGDLFDVYDSGTMIGATPTVPIIYDYSGATSDPVIAYVDDNYSHGKFTLPAGDHEISFYTRDGPMSGRGYFQVMSGDCQSTGVPEFPSLFIPVAMIISLLCAVLLIRKTGEH